MRHFRPTFRPGIFRERSCAASHFSAADAFGRLGEVKGQRIAHDGTR
jgi:hypothetical protein